MNLSPNIKLFFIASVLLTLMSSCKKEFSGNNYVAYFGGEVTNPVNRYVLFCKNNKVIDTIKLKNDNTFFKKFDSLTPGLYTFKHEPEYQYIYFDKNDSLMVNINSKDFDESIVFCGRGDEKNNFLMEMYLRNEKDRNKMFEVFDYDFDKFDKTVNSIYNNNLKFYNSKKKEIDWNDEFDIYAKASLDFPHYTKKEIYPFVHKMRTGKDVIEKLPKDYYSFRSKIDYNNEALTDFSPYVMYLSHMLNNMAEIKYHNHLSNIDLSLKNNINKLNVADSLIKNEKVKNMVLNSIAFQYLLEDQNMVNNNLFLDTYHKFSTDKSQKNEIIKIGNAIQLLKPNFDLPEINLMDVNGKTVSSDDLIKTNTVFFFWTESANSHMVEAHKKILDFKKKHPNFEFIAINLNDTEQKWKETLSKYNFSGIQEYHCIDFENIKSKWAITKIHRTIVINKDKKIINAFTNIFDIKFEENLK
ncbi:TlpA family protein disulfide reductase [Flavobacterium sp.]|uniref:TlpA family protein disulfide reductase n=1 Tax=Flavobacterium sp. TaxID=239 RepID=UPI0037537F1D